MLRTSSTKKRSSKKVGETLSNTIYHHGVKGMRWGHRKKEMKEYEKKLYKEFYRNKDEPHLKKINQLEAENARLLKKHKFDADDGGGGRTEADRKAGSKYMDNWDAIETEKYNRDVAAGQYVTKKLVEKYGQKSVNRLKTDDSTSVLAIKMGAVLVAGAIATIGGAIALDRLSD